MTTERTSGDSRRDIELMQTIDDGWNAPDGETFRPTPKSFKVDFYTLACWGNSKIVEEDLFYAFGRNEVPARTELLSIKVG
jgi:hypothetical protein